MLSWMAELQLGDYTLILKTDNVAKEIDVIDCGSGGDLTTNVMFSLKREHLSDFVAACEELFETVE